MTTDEHREQPTKEKGNETPATSNPTTLWDFLRGTVTAAALILLVYIVIHHYGQDETKAATILGVAVPVLAAIVGVSLGYYSGNKAGQADGEKAGSDAVKKQLVKQVTQLDTSLKRGILDPISKLSSPAGTTNYLTFDPSRPQSDRVEQIDGEAVKDTHEALGALKTIAGL
jgi:hypothetical protein